MQSFRKAVKADCELLLNRFQQTGTVRYDAFRQIWRDMKFEQIFYGTVKHESRSFSRLVLDTAYEFLLPPFTFQIRVGALYLLYALFHSQSADPPEKIRLALKDWDDLVKFERDSFAAQHYDVVYIWRKLLHEKSFVFSAMPRLLVFEKKRQVSQPQLRDSFVEKPSAPQTLIHNELLEELSNVHNLYQNLKSSVCPQTDQGLNLTHPDLLQTLKETVRDFSRWQKDKFFPGRSSRDEDCGEGTSSQLESSRRACLLASIKSRAYGEAAEVTKSRRHRAVEVDHVIKQENSASSLKYEKKKRKTLKYRATNNVSVSGDVWKSVTSDTDISLLTTLTSDDKPPRSFKKFKWRTEDN